MWYGVYYHKYVVDFDNFPFRVWYKKKIIQELSYRTNERKKKVLKKKQQEREKNHRDVNIVERVNIMKECCWLGF